MTPNLNNDLHHRCCCTPTTNERTNQKLLTRWYTTTDRRRLVSNPDLATEPPPPPTCAAWSEPDDYDHQLSKPESVKHLEHSRAPNTKLRRNDAARGYKARKVALEVRVGLCRGPPFELFSSLSLQRLSLSLSTCSDADGGMAPCDLVTRPA